MKPSPLVVRATNQYRRRDVLAYLGLRYYLENSAARSDRWAREVATDLVTRRGEPCYLTVKHFKEVDSSGQVTHREMFLPGPNEALAEAALLDECAKLGGGFSPSEAVFSYRLAGDSDLSGVYQHYMHGLRQRHDAIAVACKAAPDAVVLHLDIRRYYPSVTIPRANAAWLGAAEAQGMARKWVEVGMHLLQDHARASATREGHLLTGPMFSHLVGNLLLRPVDRAMSQVPVGYFRYVDDITLVGTDAQLAVAVETLKSSLDELGLSLHGQESAKWLKVSAKDWLAAEHDYVEPTRGNSWVSLIGDLKRLLVFAPELREPLLAELAEHQIRLPVPDYAAAAQERGYKTRLSELLNAVWFRRVVRKPSIARIVGQAVELRREYEVEASELLERLVAADPFLVKRLLPKVRYRFGRLAYLGDLAELGRLADAAAKVPALKYQSAVARAVATGDVSEVMGLGLNAAQSVAQPLSMRTQQVFHNRPRLDQVGQQSLAVLRMNGLSVMGPEPDNEQCQLLKFATFGVDREMMKGGEAFLREIACLHGLGDAPRHESILSTAFDVAEDITFDALEQEHQSS